MTRRRAARRRPVRRKAKRRAYFRHRPPASRFVMSLHGLLQALRHVLTGGESTWGPARRLAQRPPPRCSDCGQPLDDQHNWSDHNPLTPARDFRDHLPLATSDGRPNMTAHPIKEDPT